MGPRSAAAALFLLTLLLYAPILGHEFVIFDDPAYVVDNPNVRAGLSAAGLRWALASTELSNWHPLTRLSHMLDFELFGSWAGGHHAVNVALHALSAALLFLFLHRTTACMWRSASVAALFAWHPLHVESVAWIAERKDVLSGLLFMVTLVAYARYAIRPSPLRYAAVAGSFALGLMAKPMLVTLPFVLLLLDYWPLRRTLATTATGAGVPVRGLVAEKLPLLLLSAASALVTYRAQQAGGALVSLEKIPIESRLANAVVTPIVYLGKMLWPSGLAVFYPYEPALPALKVAGAAALLAAVSAMAFRTRRRSPALAIGWLWYLGMLTPVLGLVQAGPQRMADRYTYLPLVGVFAMVAWVLSAPGTSPTRRTTLGVLAAASLLGCLTLTRLQLRHWKDSEALFQHAIEVTPRNALAHINLGYALLARGDVAGAARSYEEAARLRPDWFPARFNAGIALASLGQLDEARAHLLKAVRLQPSEAIAHFQLGVVLEREGRWPEAIGEYRKTLRLAPGHGLARARLGVLEAGTPHRLERGAPP